MKVTGKFYTSAKPQGKRPLYPPNTRIQGLLNRSERLEKINNLTCTGKNTATRAVTVFRLPIIGGK